MLKKAFDDVEISYEWHVAASTAIIISKLFFSLNEQIIIFDSTSTAIEIQCEINVFFSCKNLMKFVQQWTLSSSVKPL